MYLLQGQIAAREITERLPSFSEMVKYYGPYLGLVLFLIVLILILQFYWFHRNLDAKDDEIKRLVAREQELNDRLLHMINEEIGYRKKKP